MVFSAGSVLKRWKKNWFVLYKDGNLKYFESPDSHIAEECIKLKTDCVRIENGTAVSCIQFVCCVIFLKSCSISAPTHAHSSALCQSDRAKIVMTATKMALRKETKKQTKQKTGQSPNQYRHFCLIVNWMWYFLKLISTFRTVGYWRRPAWRSQPREHAGAAAERQTHCCVRGNAWWHEVSRHFAFSGCGQKIKKNKMGYQWIGSWCNWAKTHTMIKQHRKTCVGRKTVNVVIFRAVCVCVCFWTNWTFSARFSAWQFALEDARLLNAASRAPPGVNPQHYGSHPPAYGGFTLFNFPRTCWTRIRNC